MLIGVDVLRTGELDRLLTRAWFRRYTYAAEELAVADRYGAGRAREFLAGRFAGKEAALKAIRSGVGAGVTPRQVAILREESGAPVVRLSGAAAHRAADLGIAAVQVSIAHKEDLVIAVAIAEQRHEKGDGNV
ncbi:holo-ACP synthase [Streptomyces sp. x-80]|jgi:holo-[acyl-carrier protein] synthase|uniref:holo-ACP synthase n=1 Tax=Streptomyces sp. x-80 TaxID=2789282 RepID=UPI00398024CF